MAEGLRAFETFPRAWLAQVTRFHADRYRAGHHPSAVFTEDERWHRRIHHDDRVDVWLISWLPSQGTQLHDHGGSAGSLTVVEGELTELVPAGWSDGRMSLRRRVHSAGANVTFGRHHIHDVVNGGAQPAVSVHAYSPPLTTMRFYDLVDGDLALSHSLATSDPEPAAIGQRAS